jgi:hypothetical protein
MTPRPPLLALCIAVLGCSDAPEEPLDRLANCVTDHRSVAVTNYHGGPDKLGHQPREIELTPDAVETSGLAITWSSARLHAETIDGIEYAPHIYGSPLYVDGLEVTVGPHAGAEVSAVLTTTSNGWVYAINASESDCAMEAGDILWERRIVSPSVVAKLDGGMPMGTLGTPVLDLEANPPRLYVAALDRDAGWQVHALAAGSGLPLDGWPVTLDAPTIEANNTNGPARFWSADTMSQRGALSLSPPRDRVYVPFGTFWGEGAGWLVAVDTVAPRIVASFSSAPWREPSSNGGMWGSAGPTVGDDGHVWVTTGNGPPQVGPAADSWASSLLELSPDLDIERVYTPANYCVLDEGNMDLGASQPLLLPTQDGATPHLVAFGGKQGLVYLVDRDAMPRAGFGRGECRRDMDGDTSLHPLDPQPYWDHPGPLSVFGPYSDEFGEIDHAKMRTKLAYFEDLAGTPWRLVTGSSKLSESSTLSVPPALAKLRLVTADDEPASLAIEALETTITLANPGPPVISSHAGHDAIVWVLDANAPRTASLVDPATPGPVLYAFAAEDLRPLWRSPAGALAQAGKYATVVVAHGEVIVGSDRIVAFGLQPAASPVPR